MSINAVDIGTPTTPPFVSVLNAPTSFARTVTAVGSTSLEYDWVAPTQGTAVGFRIINNSTGLQEGADILWGTTTGSATGLNPSTAYTHKVVTYDATAVSTASNTAGDTTAAISGTAIYSTGSPQTISISGDYYLAEDITSTGGAITISAANVLLDCNWQAIEFNTGDSDNTWGIQASGSPDDVTIRRADISHAGVATGCKGIYPRGANWERSYFAIDDAGLNGDFMPIGNLDGVYDIPNIKVHHNYTQAGGYATATNSVATRGIYLQHRGADAYAEVHHNICTESQWPLTFTAWGRDTIPTVISPIYQNRLQSNRIENTKGPYALNITQSKKLDIYYNRCTAYNGRGIYFSGNGDGDTNASTNNEFQYNTVGGNFYTAEKTGGGGFADEDNYGLRIRYGSGDNNIHHNNIITTMNLASASASAQNLFIGSDNADTYMTNLTVANNITITNEGYASADYQCWLWDDINDIAVTDNQWMQKTGGVKEALNGTPTIGSKVETGTTAYAPSDSGTPAQVTGLTLTKFFGSYVLSWTESTEADVWEYQVYRDGTPLTQLTQSGRKAHASVPDPFYVDYEPGVVTNYSVAAVTLTGTEGTASATSATSGAANGWQ